jgi:hypothetical protein
MFTGELYRPAELNYQSHGNWRLARLCKQQESRLLSAA